MLMACANSLRPLPVSFTYTPDQTVQPVAKAGSVYVKVKVNDVRQNKDLGEAGNAIGTAPIVTQDDPAEVIRAGVESELRNRGFELGAGNALVTIDLEGLAVKQTMPTAALMVPAVALIDSDQVRAIAIMAVHVQHDSGAFIYTKRISGKVAFAAKIQNETPSSMSERALNYAIDEAVWNLMADHAFINALLATRNPAKQAPPVAHSVP
jgi:uncharacterized lipoprotein YajG